MEKRPQFIPTQVPTKIRQIFSHVEECQPPQDKHFPTWRSASFVQMLL